MFECVVVWFDWMGLMLVVNWLVGMLLYGY